MATMTARNLPRGSGRSGPRTELLLEDIEAYYIFMAVKRTQKVPGDIAEVGVYKGGSAKIICSAKGDKSLHLFDTFEGLPKVDDIDMVWPFYEANLPCHTTR